MAPAVLWLLRIDDNITFANVNFIEDFINNELALKPGIRHIVLIFNSVSDVDATALEVLENLNRVLQTSRITLHLPEAKRARTG